MAALNIESIAASLRNCSLNNEREAAPPHQPAEAAAEIQEVAVELNSDGAFPNHWNQCLDKRAGELFYANWKKGERRTEVPRIESSGLQASYYSSEDNKSDYAGDIEEEEDNDGEVEDSEDFFGANSRTSYSSSSADSDAGGENGVILVVAGCKSCFMYFMVPKLVEGCPTCGGCLLHFG